jgi:hypothetical protein
MPPIMPIFFIYNNSFATQFFILSYNYKTEYKFYSITVAAALLLEGKHTALSLAGLLSCSKCCRFRDKMNHPEAKFEVWESRVKGRKLHSAV